MERQGSPQEPLFSLRGLVSFDQLENTLAMIITKMHRQEEVIQQLRGFCDSFVTQNRFVEKINYIEDFMNKLSRRLDLVDEYATFPAGDNK